MTPVFYAHLACCLGLVVAVVDIAWFFKHPWHIAFTHWAFSLVLLYFALLRWAPGSAALPELAVLAWGGTLGVNAGYWLLLFPRRLRNGEDMLSKLTPPSVAKHGGSVLWLLGHAVASGQTLPSVTGARLALLLLLPSCYVVFSIVRHSRTGSWIYGDFFARPRVRLGFCLAPALGYCAALVVVPAIINLHLPSWVPACLLMATPLHFVLRWRVVKAKVWKQSS